MSNTEYEPSVGAMMKHGILQRISLTYTEAVYENADARTAEWFLVESPWPIIGLMVTYLLVTVKLLPNYMEKRKPLPLRGTIIFFNAFQIAVNAWLVYECLVSGWAMQYNWICEQVDYSRNPLAMRMASVVYYYFLMKIFDFSDTVFFVLRKKNNQVTYLHLFHHVSTLWITWLGVKYAAGGTGACFVMLNSAVHVVMYGYYFLSAMGPWIRPYLWWKKYITTIQMVLNALITGCQAGVFLKYNYLSVILVDFILFSNFYKQSYKKKGELKKMDEIKEKDI